MYIREIPTTTTMISFAKRPSQVTIVSEALQAMLDGLMTLICSSTGSGKTVMLAHLMAELLKVLYPGFNPLNSKLGWAAPGTVRLKAPPQLMFIVHRDKLVTQTVKSFREVFHWLGTVDPFYRTLERGITAIKSGQDYNHFAPIVVVSQQSLKSKKLRQMIRVGTLNVKAAFFDECHTTRKCPTGCDMVDILKPLGVMIGGTTATPFWSDATVEASVFFDKVVCGPSFGELVESGELCPLYYMQPDMPNQTFETIIDRFGRAKEKLIECSYTFPAELDYAVAKWIEVSMGLPMKTICFARSVDHGHDIVAAFARAGIRAAVVSYDLKDSERDDIFLEYERPGSGLNILISVDALGVGYNYPRIEIVMLLAPVHSLARHWQQMGRGARLSSDPTFTKFVCYVIDYVHNITRHGDYGIPDVVKLTPELILGRKPKPKGKGVAPTKVCPKCNFTNFASAKRCNAFKFNEEGVRIFTCTHEFPVKDSAVRNQIIPGQLHRVFLPGMTMNDDDRIQMFRTMRAKKYARGRNPNAAIRQFNESPLAGSMRMPELTDVSELKYYTVGCLRGKADSMDDARRFMAELLKKRKKMPTKWTTALIHSLLLLEYDSPVSEEICAELWNDHALPMDIVEFCLA